MHKRTSGFKLISALLMAVFVMQPFSTPSMIDLLSGRNTTVAHAAGPVQPDAGSVIFLPLILRPSGPPQFVINSPEADTSFGGVTFFSIQPTSADVIERVAFRAGGRELATDTDGRDGFKVFLTAAELPAGPIQLTATASGPGGESSQTVNVTVVPNPPTSAVIGPAGGVLASEVGSVISIRPGSVLTDTAMSVDELTQFETTTRHGLQWENMGVTFLGAQAVTAGGPISEPFGMVASAGVARRVKPGEAVVNYRIAPDVDGDGIDEIVVVNTASIGPQDYVIANPIETVQIQSAGMPLSRASVGAASQNGAISGPPGTLLDVQMTGLNPNSVRGNVALFRSVDGQTREVVGTVLSATDGSTQQTFSVAIPMLPVGPATFVVLNKSTGYASDPMELTILAAAPLDRPATQIIDDYFAQSIEYMTSLPRISPDANSGTFAEIEQMQVMRDQYQQLATIYPQMEADESAQVQQMLDDLATQIVGSDLLNTLAARQKALRAAGWQVLGPESSAAPAGCWTREERKLFNYLVLIGGTAGGLGCALGGIGAGFIWTGPPGAAAAAVGATICGAGFTLVAGVLAIEGGDVPDCEQPPQPECTPAPAAGGDGPSRSRGAEVDVPPTTGMGSAPPPGGDGCGNGDGDGGGGRLRGAQQTDLAGRFVVKIFSNGKATPFTGVSDAGGYFFVPFVPAGEPFNAVAIDLATGETRTFVGVGPDTGDSVHMNFNFFGEGEFVPTIRWDGGGDGTSWWDEQNWDLDRVPNEADSVGIDVTGTVTVTFDGGVRKTTIASLRSAENLDFLTGSLTVNAPSTVTGTLAISDKFTLIAAGAGTLFTASGPLFIDGANLSAQDGGKISFPGLTSYAGSEIENITTLLADGPGSVIDFSDVTTLKGDTHEFFSSAHLDVKAFNGGRVDFSGVAQIDVGRVQVSADGAGSTIDFSALTRFGRSGGGNAFLKATDSGRILASQLIELAGAGLHLDATGQLSTSQIITVTDALIQVDNASPDLSHVKNVDGSDLTATQGGVLSLPAVTSYAGNGSNFFTAWRADGAGSTISLPATTALSGNTFTNDRLTIDAVVGGAINLSNLPEITVGMVQFTANGVNSTIDLSALTRFERNTRGDSFLKPINGGAILASGLTTLDSVGLILDGTGTLATSQITTLTGGRAEVTGVTPDFSGMTNVNGSSFIVSGGGTISLPQITSFAGDPSRSLTQLRAEGAGSMLAFSTFTALAGTTFVNDKLVVTAVDGGVIDLSHVPQITVGKVQFTADGADSAIDLSALTRFERNGTGDSFLKPINGGAISLNSGTTRVKNVNVVLTSGSTLAVGTLALETGSILSGSGDLAANLINDGAVKPGASPGSIQVGGSYSQTVDGTLVVEVGGPTAGTDFDQLVVAGAATLAGTLEVHLINNLVPTVGSTFAVLTGGSRSGVFGTVNGLSIDGSKTFAVTYDSKDVLLTVEAVP